MLGPVVLEDALEVAHARDQPEVADEDRDPDRLLDQHEDDRVRQEMANQRRDPDRQQEEQAYGEDDRHHDRPGPGAAAHLHVGLLGLELGVGRDAERLEADLQRFDQRSNASDNREAQPAMALQRGDERLGHHLDLAERRLGRLEPVALLQLLRRRLAHRDGPGRDAAHHHSLENGLPADGSVARCLEGRGIAHASMLSAARPAALRISPAPRYGCTAGQRALRTLSSSVVSWIASGRSTTTLIRRLHEGPVMRTTAVCAGSIIATRATSAWAPSTKMSTSTIRADAVPSFSRSIA